jgi:lysophospholipase L1-like esterase
MRPAARRSTARSWAVVAALAAAVLVLGLVVAVSMRGAASRAAPAPQTAYVAAARQYESAFGPCEQQLDRTQPDGVPRMAVVGASFTAGVGSSPGQSWAAQLARRLHWDAVIYGVPGAGYARPGTRHGGPVATELAHVGLPRLDPSLIIVQAGHDDIGIPTALERQRVTQAIHLIRAQAPRARLVLLTVFPGRAPQAAATRTDQTIVSAARAADPAVLIIDPLTGHWLFPHIHDGLHPTAAGSAWIARHVAAALGIRPFPRPPGQRPLICDHP